MSGASTAASSCALSSAESRTTRWICSPGAARLTQARCGLRSPGTPSSSTTTRISVTARRDLNRTAVTPMEHDSGPWIQTATAKPPGRISLRGRIAPVPGGSVPAPVHGMAALVTSVARAILEGGDVDLLQDMCSAHGAGTVAARSGHVALFTLDVCDAGASRGRTSPSLPANPAQWARSVKVSMAAQSTTTC